MSNIGCLYEEGQGTEQDYAKAIEWYEKSANLGNVIAMQNLGDLYSDDQSTVLDYAKAVEWYQKAVDLGSIRKRRTWENPMPSPISDICLIKAWVRSRILPKPLNTIRKRLIWGLTGR